MSDLALIQETVVYGANGAAEEEVEYSWKQTAFAEWSSKDEDKLSDMFRDASLLTLVDRSRYQDPIFHQYQKLPFEVREHILKMALDEFDRRTVLVHPNDCDTIKSPPLLQVSHETRVVAQSVYTPHESNGTKRKFVVHINVNKDDLYINCNFRVDGQRFPSGLHATINAYPYLLDRVEQLFMNLREMTKLTSAYRPNPPEVTHGHDLWEILDVDCPNLKTLFALINGPFINCTYLDLTQISNDQKYFWSPNPTPAITIANEYFFLQRSFVDAQEDGVCTNVTLGQLIEPDLWDMAHPRDSSSQELGFYLVKDVLSPGALV